MNLINRTSQAEEKKLSAQFVDFIDLTDEMLEEINTSDFGRVQGGFGFSCGSCGSCGFGSCSCGSCSCGSCWFGVIFIGSCGSCSCSCSCGDFGSCSCGDF